MALSPGLLSGFRRLLLRNRCHQQGRGFPDILRFLFCGFRFHIFQHMRRLNAFLRSPAGDGCQLVGLVEMQRVILVVIETDLHGGAKQIDRHCSSVAVLSLHKGALLRHLADEILIGLLLIAQAAHQPPAASGDLRRVEREGLGFCHLR